MPDARRSRGRGTWKAPARRVREGRRPPAAPRPAVLAVDIGNSRVTIAVVRGDRPRGLQHLPARRTEAVAIAAALAHAVAGAGRGTAIEGAVLCSVVPALTAPWLRAMRRTIGKPPLIVTAGVLREMPIHYRHPDQVGPDRLANAVAARALYGTPAIVVDFGTATNFDCVSRDGAFAGGVIAPGVTTAADALYDRAARLERVALGPQRRTLGHSTAEALRAGLVHGAAAMVDGLVRRLANDMNARPHVIATGGVAGLIVNECETVHHIDEGLTLKGLARIWEEAQ